MMKRHVSICLLGVALIAPPALAQTSQSPAGQAGSQSAQKPAQTPAGQAGSQSAQKPAQSPAGQAGSQSALNLPQQLKQKLQDQGFADVRVVPGSFLVSAKDKDGDPVTMVIGPHSMTVFTVSSTAGGARQETSGQSMKSQASDTQPRSGQARSGKMQFVTQNNPNLWRASKLDGVDVYNDQNEKIGDITEVLLDRQGKVEAVVIGVGGFLGIGERNVAVPFANLQWQMTDRDNVARTDAGRNTTTGTAGTAPANRPAASGGATASGERSARTAADASGNQANNRQTRDAPARAILPGASKDELKNAPEFKYAG